MLVSWLSYFQNLNVPLHKTGCWHIVLAYLVLIASRTVNSFGCLFATIGLCSMHCIAVNMFPSTINFLHFIQLIKYMNQAIILDYSHYACSIYSCIHTKEKEW